MKKFTHIVEKSNISSRYKVDINLSLIIETEDEGEAGYISDSILSSIEKLYDYTILNIEETTEKIEEKKRTII
jgi:hypothetical protein